MFDNYLVKDGAMSPMDMRYLVERYESYGLTEIVEENGKRQWKDLCVIDYFGGLTLPCEWIICKNNTVSHREDLSEIIITGDNIFYFY